MVGVPEILQIMAISLPQFLVLQLPLLIPVGNPVMVIERELVRFASVAVTFEE